MSAKISALTPATAIANSDVIAGLQGGANVKITRPIFLTTTGTDSIGLTGVGGSVVQINNPGTVAITCAGTNNFQLIQAATSSGMVINALGEIGLGLANAPQILIQNDLLALLHLTTVGDILITPGAGRQVTIGYTPGTPGNWAGSPTDYQAAIDRIAAAVVALRLGVPIP